ncbi:hypothetical protein FBZ92_105159 [Nitrospirillum viridazoti]|uniref:Uncharacterized protein n=1 Tax=Nitrospirillum amazonense TaxID=28077 RepID=A0A560IZ21_9PROT|nr:hypothetical protein FBZ92_105159 [Nitrospirillum amazonense]
MGRGMSRRNGVIIGGAALVVIAIAILYTQISIFVVQPIGSLPEGRTLVISRLNKMNFVDSADAMCARIQGGVNLLCRGMVLGTIVKNSTIYLRLPYSEWLYGISTDGKKYDR